MTTSSAVPPDAAVQPDAAEARVDAVAHAAQQAQAWLAAAAPSTVGASLRALADAMEAAGGRLVEIAAQETHLDRPKLSSEIARTCGQLRMFADVTEIGALWDAVIDHADPASNPPRPDLRKTMRPVGVVAVFAASNFPFAFGALGGDTASALAARCPVVVRAHPAQPRLGEELADVVAATLSARHAPALISVVRGGGFEIGRALVAHPAVRAVGFTGSLTGGLALAEVAASRDDPIPVYAEMGSVNPLLLSPGTIAQRGTQVCEQLVGSLRVGHGQLCTKPGLIAVPAGAAGDRFVAALRDALGQVPAQDLLHEPIRQALADRIARDGRDPGTRVLLDGAVTRNPLGFSLSETDVTAALARPDAVQESFGPYALVVRYQRPDQLVSLLLACPGSLTTTIHAVPDELGEPWLHAIAEQAATGSGRVVWNGMPTGVAVVDAMTHGGPYPATSDGMHTAVGPAATRRFLRPVTYQDTPDALLPAPVQEANPWSSPRLVDRTYVGPEARPGEAARR